MLVKYNILLYAWGAAVAQRKGWREIKEKEKDPELSSRPSGQPFKNIYVYVGIFIGNRLLCLRLLFPSVLLPLVNTFCYDTNFGCKSNAGLILCRPFQISSKKRTDEFSDENIHLGRKAVSKWPFICTEYRTIVLLRTIILKHILRLKCYWTHSEVCKYYW
jgi:hypothetical protein